MYHIYFVTKQEFEEAIKMMLESLLFVKSNCSWDNNTFNFEMKQDMQNFVCILRNKGFNFTISNNS